MGKLIIFTRACGDYQKPSGLSRGGFLCRSPRVIVVEKLRQPYTIWTRRPMSQPRLSVFADAAETSPSPRRASKSHWIFPTSEVAFPHEKEEDQKSVKFVILHVADSLLFWSTLLAEAYYGKTAEPFVVWHCWRVRGRSSLRATLNSARSSVSTNRIYVDRLRCLTQQDQMPAE